MADPIGDNWLTVSQAAERIGVSRQRVAHWIEQGRINASWSDVAQRWLIREQDAIKPRELKPGRPRQPDTGTH